MKNILLLLLCVPFYSIAQEKNHMVIKNITIADSSYFKCLGPFWDLRKVKEIDHERSSLYFDTNTVIIAIDDAVYYVYPVSKNKDSLLINTSDPHVNWKNFSLCTTFDLKHIAVIENELIRFYYLKTEEAGAYSEIFRLGITSVTTTKKRLE